MIPLVRPTYWPWRKTKDVWWGGQTRIGEFQSAGPLTLAEATMSGCAGDAWSTGGPPRRSKRCKEAASQAKALEHDARVIEVLAAATQKRIKLAEIATRMETEKTVVNAAVEALNFNLNASTAVFTTGFSASILIATPKLSNSVGISDSVGSKIVLVTLTQ
jgi:hypothetical protein